MTTQKEIVNHESCLAQGLLKLLSGKWKPRIFRLVIEGDLGIT
jgi:DNA-binding HxlR family transcriptional regulator